MTSELKVDKITPASGTNTQIGESGDTITIPSGCTITNSGTATNFGASLSGSTNNTVVTVTGANAMQGEANMTFDGTQLVLTDSNEGTDNLLVKTTSDNSISMALEKSDLKFDIGLDHNNAGDKNFYIRERTQDGSLTNAVRLMIDSNGKVGINKTDPSGMLAVVNSHDHEYMGQFHNSHGGNGQYGLQIKFDVARDNNSQHAIHFQDGTTRFKVWSDGDVVNHDNSYGSTSDERIKQDIRDSNSQWNDIKAVKVRNFKKKDDVRQYGENAWEQIGVVAQELETVSPKLIKNCDPTEGDILSDSSFGTLYQEGDEIPEGKNIGDIKEIKEQVKKVSYSVLYMKSIKALQEAMARIETLEAKVAALESK